MISKYFEPCDSVWRGLGLLQDSGLTLNPEYGRFDATLRYELVDREVKHYPGCICGSVILGAAIPTECELFGKVCNPENPVGPCMVSSEGACAAYYKYGE